MNKSGVIIDNKSVLRSDEDAIRVLNLQKSFKKLKVLKGIDFSVKRGSITALLGPNGAGKTTTIKILSTLLLPDAGSALVNGFDVIKQADEVRRIIGLTGQYAAVDEYLTGGENLRMMGRLYRMDFPQIKKRTEELLSEFELLDASNRIVKTYSGGMRRRLDLALSLIASPPILFLDEPTTGLDPRSRLTMWEMVKKLAEEGTTVLLTTQYMEEADRLAEWIIVLDEGKIIAEGTSEELKNRVGSERLELTITDTKNLQNAKRLIKEKGVHVDEKRKLLSIPMTGGIKKLNQILYELQKAEISVESLSLHRPTLDDVFLALTGHTTTIETDEKERKNEK